MAKKITDKIPAQQVLAMHIAVANGQPIGSVAKSMDVSYDTVYSIVRKGARTDVTVPDHIKDKLIALFGNYRLDTSKWRTGTLRKPKQKHVSSNGHEAEISKTGAIIDRYIRAYEAFEEAKAELDEAKSAMYAGGLEAVITPLVQKMKESKHRKGA